MISEWSLLNPGRRSTAAHNQGFDATVTFRFFLCTISEYFPKYGNVWDSQKIQTVLLSPLRILNFKLQIADPP